MFRKWQDYKTVTTYQTIVHVKLRGLGCVHMDNVGGLRMYVCMCACEFTCYLCGCLQLCMHVYVCIRVYVYAKGMCMCASMRACSVEINNKVYVPFSYTECSAQKIRKLLHINSCWLNIMLPYLIRRIFQSCLTKFD